MQIAVLGIDLGKNSCSIVGLDHTGSGLPSFLDRTEHLNENRLCNQHFSEPFDQGL